MATHSSILAWRIPGIGEPGLWGLWGHTGSHTTEVTWQQQFKDVHAHTQFQVLTLTNLGPSFPKSQSPSSFLCMDTSLPIYIVLTSGHRHSVNLALTSPEDAACVLYVITCCLNKYQVRLCNFTARDFGWECIFVKIAYSIVASHISHFYSQAPKGRPWIMTSNPCHTQTFLVFQALFFS